MAVIEWEWKRQAVGPEEIIDAARSIPTTRDRLTANLTSRWVPAKRYLEWAKNALARGGDDGWDVAASWAKRAVCRQMDGLLVHNHLGSFLGQNNERKSEYLRALGIPGLSILRQMVIDPRNQIEHAYDIATGDQAQQAYEVADLFLRATEEEAQIPAIVARGFEAIKGMAVSTAPGNEYCTYFIELKRDSSPSLLITTFAQRPEALILHPGDELLMACPIEQFSAEQAIRLNALARECLTSGSYSSYGLGSDLVSAIKTALKIA